MKRKMALLYGGKSAEHEVSLSTALAVIAALDKSKFEVYPIFITKNGEWIRGTQLEDDVTEVSRLIFESDEATSVTDALSLSIPEQQNFDVIFPLLHGPNGEDGTVQGVLELMNLPYVGNGVLASSAGMDKVIMKNLFAQAGLPQVKYVWCLRSEWQENKKKIEQQIETEIGFPCFVKPANLGSSVGISKCTNQSELEAAFVEAFQFDRKVIVEAGVEAREIELAVLGNDNPKCSVAGELVLQKAFYDYNAKYVDGSTGLVIPAELPEATYKTLEELAIRAFKALDCAGLVRADFFLTKTGQIYINEVNTMPGFTPVSMYPRLWQASNLSYAELIELLVDLAIERHQEKQMIQYTV